MGNSTEENPSFDFPSDTARKYNVCLVATNADSCKDTTCYLVVIDEGFTVYVPNAFTPESSKGINDGFFPVVTGAKDYVLYIFDRWGGLVFSSNSPDYPWKGRTRESGEKVDDGIYVWKFVIDDEVHGQHEYMGRVNLLR